MAKRKRTNNNLQNITQKTKDRATRTPVIPVIAVPAQHVTSVELLLLHTSVNKSYHVL